MSKSKILFLLFLLIFVINILHTGPDLGSFGKGILLNIHKNGLWRSARFANSSNFADYVVFLRGQIPEDGRVVLPPDAVTKSALSNTPHMQFFLSPREVVNCTTLACGSTFIGEENTYILVMGLERFPGPEIKDQPSHVRMFNDTWGVYGQDVGVGRGGEPQTLLTAGDLLKGVVLPLGFFAFFLLVGFLFSSWMLPDTSPWFLLGVGYGLILGIFSLLTYLGLLLLPEMDLRIVVYAFSLLLILILLFRTWRKGAGPIVSPFENLIRSISIPVVLIWGVSTLLFFVAVGSGFHATDAIVLWGAKGEGIATEGLKALNVWGTKTTHYPIHIPLLIANFSSAFGNSLPASKAMFPGYYFALLMVIYGYVARGGKKNNLGMGVLAFGTLPILIRHARIGYGNLPLTFHLVVSLMLFSEMTPIGKKKEWNSVGLLISMYAIFTVWTRPEGFLILLGVGGIQMCFGRLRSRPVSPWRTTKYLLLTPAAFFVFWRLTSLPYSVDGSIEVLIKGAFSSLTRGNLQIRDLLFVFQYIGRQMINLEAWGNVSIAGLAGVIYYLRGQHAKEQNTRFIFMSGLGSLFVVVCMYYLFAFDEVHDISWWLNSGFNRMIMPGMTLVWVSVLGIFSEGT